MKRRTTLPTLAVLLLLTSAALAQWAGPYDLSWWSVDAGGTTCTAEGYTLGATVGQPEAGVLSGGG